MDNLLEYLFYFILIVSFLSSLFKKKEVPKTPPSTLPQPVERSKTDGFDEFEFSSDAPSKEDFDILSEIESIFNEELGTPKQKPKTKTKFDHYSYSEQSNKSLETESPNYDNIDFETSKNLEAQSRFKRREIFVDSNIEKAAELFEQVLNNQRTKKQELHPLVKKIRNPKAIKDYILVAEILNKPLALRK